MPTYPRLAQLLGAMSKDSTGDWDEIVDHLRESWISDYSGKHGASDLVEVTTSGFNYLFDITAERLICAWGISRGRNGKARDEARMRGHPLSAGPTYHRGHAIAHSLGGETDINLVPQLGSVNVGSFRTLEKEAVGTLGALYFTYWIYSVEAKPEESQKPSSVEQGLLTRDGSARIVPHPN